MHPNPDNVIHRRQSPRHTHIRAEKEREWIWKDKQRRASPLFLLNFKFDGYSFDSQKLFHSLTVPFLCYFIRRWMSSPISLKKAEVLLSIVGMCDYTCVCFPVLSLFLQALFLYPLVQVFLFHVAIFHQLSGHILKWGHRKGKWGFHIKDRLFTARLHSDQVFPAGLGDSLLWGLSVHYRMSKSLPGLYLLEASSVVTVKNVFHNPGALLVGI